MKKKSNKKYANKKLANDELQDIAIELDRMINDIIIAVVNYKFLMFISGYSCINEINAVLGKLQEVEMLFSKSLEVFKKPAAQSFEVKLNSDTTSSFILPMRDDFIYPRFNLPGIISDTTSSFILPIIKQITNER